ETAPLGRALGNAGRGARPRRPARPGDSRLRALGRDPAHSARLQDACRPRHRAAGRPPTSGAAVAAVAGPRSATARRRVVSQQVWNVQGSLTPLGGGPKVEIAIPLPAR